MSDPRFHANRPPPSDPLGGRLDALRADTERLAMPMAPAIRRRGNRRSAVQVAGTTLAAVSAIGLGAFVLPLGGTSDDDQPVTTPSATITTPSESVTTPPVETGLPSSVLLDAAGLEELQIFPDGGSLGWSVESTHEDPGLALSSVCLPRQASPDSTQSLAAEYLPAEPETSEPPIGRPSAAAEMIMVQPDAATADTTLATLRDWLLACGGADDTQPVGAGTLEGAADGGWYVEVLARIPGADVGLVHQVALARSGSVVVGVLLTTNNQEAPMLDAAFAVLQAALAKLCQTTGTTCPADEITGEETISGSPSDVEGPLLTLEDLPTWDGALPWDTVEDVPAEAYAVACHPLWSDLGAESEIERTFAVSSAEPGGGASAIEVVATFADEAEAEAAVAEMRASMASCEGRPDVGAEIPVEMLDPIEYGDSAWLMTLPGGGEAPDSLMMVGFVRSGSTAALFTLGYPEATDLPSGPFLITLDLAAAKIA